jgi:hypothetical protein
MIFREMGLTGSKIGMRRIITVILLSKILRGQRKVINGLSGDYPEMPERVTPLPEEV